MPLINDIITLSSTLELAIDGDLLDRSLDTYAQEFATTGIAFGVTSARHELMYRFTGFGFPTEDPVPKAFESGLLPLARNDVRTLYESVSTLSNIDGWGVEFGTQSGFEKAHCTFDIVRPYPLASLARQTGAPHSLQRCVRTLDRHGLSRTGLLALDFRSNTVSVYTYPSRRQLAPENLTRLLTDLEVQVSDEDTLRGAEDAFALYVTLGWDHSDVIRVCLPTIERGHPPASTPSETFLRTFADQTPFESKARYFIHGMTLSAQGSYSELEGLYRSMPGEFWESAVARRPHWQAVDDRPQPDAAIANDQS